VKPDFADLEYLAWVKTKPQDETYEGVDGTICPIAQFLKATGRAALPVVHSEDWYDDFFIVKQRKQPVSHRHQAKSFRATAALHPNNTFKHIAVRLQLLLDKQNVNDFYFVMKGN
jgi:hypothetical protein